MGKGVRGEYDTEEDEGRKEDGGEDDTDWTSGDGSSASGASSTVDNTFLMEGTDRKLGVAEDRMG